MAEETKETKTRDTHVPRPGAKIYEIVKWPDPILMKKTAKVTEFGPELQKLVDDMFDSMYIAQGIGLACEMVPPPRNGGITIRRRRNRTVWGQLEETLQ